MRVCQLSTNVPTCSLDDLKDVPNLSVRDAINAKTRHILGQSTGVVAASSGSVGGGGGTFNSRAIKRAVRRQSPVRMVDQDQHQDTLCIPTPSQLNKMLGVYAGGPPSQQTPQPPPFTPNGSRFPQPTPSPHYAPADMRSPPLVSPSQAPMAQRVLHPQADMGVQMRMQIHPSMAAVNYMTYEPAVIQHLAQRPELCLAGCVFHVFDIDKMITDKLDLQNLVYAIKFHGGEIEFGNKAYSQERIQLITHVITDSWRTQSSRQAMTADRKRLVTLQWLADVITQRKMDVPWKMAHIPSVYNEQYRPYTGKLISLAGFDEHERPAMHYMVETIGAKVTPFIAKYNHILISKTRMNEKVDKAREWDIPVVNYQWLCDVYANILTPDRAFNLDPRYQVGQPTYEVIQSPMQLETVSQDFKAVLLFWKQPILVRPEVWMRIEEEKQRLNNDELHFPGIKMQNQSAPPTEEQIKAEEQREKMKMEVDVNPKNQFPEVTVAFGGIDERNKEILKAKVRFLGGKVTDDFRAATHVVLINGRRTVPLLEAIALGKNIMSPEWVMQSYDYKKWQDTYSFFLRDDEVERLLGYSCKRSILRARHQPVLEDVTFHVSPSVEPDAATIKHLIKLAGGKVDEQRPSPAFIIKCVETDSPYIVISCDVDAKMYQYLTDCNFPLYNVDVVLTAILRQELEVNPNYRVPIPGAMMVQRMPSHQFHHPGGPMVQPQGPPPQFRPPPPQHMRPVGM